MAVVRVGNRPEQRVDIGPTLDLGTYPQTPVERIVRPPATDHVGQPAAVPCGTCLHAPVCRLTGAMLEVLGSAAQDVVVDDGLRVVATAWRVECDHYLGERPAAIPEPVRTTPSAVDRMQESRLRGRDRMLEVKEAKGTIAPRPATSPGRHPGKAGEEEEKARRAAECVAALERHNGDRRAAAAELGIRPNAFSMIVKFADRRQAVTP